MELPSIVSFIARKNANIESENSRTRIEIQYLQISQNPMNYGNFTRGPQRCWALVGQQPPLQHVSDTQFKGVWFFQVFSFGHSETL